jgi:hypothetical protein
MTDILQSDDAERVKARIAPIQDLFLQLEKTLRAHRTYEAGHVTIAEFERRLFAKFTEILAERSEMVVAIKPYEYQYEGRPVYTNTDKRANFSFRFHQDGVRQFAFSQGMTPEELRQLIQIIQTDFESYEFSDDDTVTLLWKSQMEHITYIAVETFVQQGEDTTDLETLLTEFERKFFQDTAPADIGPILASGAEKRRRIKEEDILELSQLPEIRLEDVASAEGVAAQIRKEVVDEEQTVLKRMILVLMRILIASEKDQHFASTAKVLERVVNSLIRSGEYEMASKVLGKLIELSDAKNNPNAVNASLIRNFLTGLLRPATFESIRKDIAYFDDARIRGFGGLANVLPETCASLVFDIFCQTQSEVLRRALLPALARFGASHATEFGRAIPNADELLQMNLTDLFATIGSTQAQSQLRRLFQKGAERIRAHVIDLAIAQMPELAHALVESGLKDSSRGVRRKALQFLIAHPGKKLAKVLFEIAQSEELDRWDRVEKRDCYRALARLGGAPLLPFFQDQLNRTVWSEKTTDRQIAAAWALRDLGTSEAQKAVEEASRKRLASKDLKEACEEILKTWKGTE